MRLSLLDRSRTRAGRSEQAALTDSVERAVAAIGQRTSRIRLGSGGVMLPNHRPLLVAEQFLMLEALTPRRVDLGLGRSLGFPAPVRAALGSPGGGPQG